MEAQWHSLCLGVLLYLLWLWKALEFIFFSLASEGASSLHLL